MIPCQMRSSLGYAKFIKFTRKKNGETEILIIHKVFQMFMMCREIFYA